MGFLDLMPFGDKVQAAMGAVYNIAYTPINAVLGMVGIAAGDDPDAANKAYASSLSQSVTDVAVYASRGIDNVFGTKTEKVVRDVLTDANQNLFNVSYNGNYRPLTTYEKMDLEQDIEERRMRAEMEMIYADSTAMQIELEGQIAEYNAALANLEQGNTYMTEEGTTITQTPEQAAKVVERIETVQIYRPNKDANVSPNVVLRRPEYG